MRRSLQHSSEAMNVGIASSKRLGLLTFFEDSFKTLLTTFLQKMSVGKKVLPMVSPSKVLANIITCCPHPPGDDQICWTDTYELA